MALLRSGEKLAGTVKLRIRVQHLFEIGLACGLLAFVAPLMMLIAAALLLESGRPVFFAQVRLGQHGRPFRMLKFRKFHAKEGSSGLPLTLTADSRMTRVGRILCSTKLDELPQLWNVVRGDMAVVGPRPESPAFADCFHGWVARVLDHRPGIVGPSQAVFRDESLLFTHEADPTILYRDVLLPAKACIDLAYYQQRTILSDLRWIAVCVLATLRCAPAFVERQYASVGAYSPAGTAGRRMLAGGEKPAGGP